MPKKRYILFIKRLSNKDMRGWYGLRGIFPSVRIAEQRLPELCNKGNNFAEIVEMDTLRVVKTLKKGADSVWK